MPLTRYDVSYGNLTNVYTSPTGLTDVRTLQPELGGGMNVGDYFDLTESEAQQISPALHAGRYRFVAIDVGATAANMVQGAVLGWAPGSQVAQLGINTVGSGQTAGTYNIVGSGGGATTQATIQVVIGSGGTIISATVLNGGAGYTSTPTFTVAAGGTPGTLVAQMVVDPNRVTSYDKGIGAGASGNIPRAFCLGWTAAQISAAQVLAGAYGFVQEAGIATALAAASGVTGTTPGVPVSVVANGTGTVNTAAVSGTQTPLFVGTALDAPVISSLFRLAVDVAMQQG